MNRKKISEKNRKIIFKKLKIQNLDPQKRIDFDGKIIHWLHYGERNSNLGWNIDHIDHNNNNNNNNNLRAVHFKTHEKLNKTFNTKNKNNFIKINFGTSGIREKIGEKRNQLNSSTIKSIAESYLKFLLSKNKNNKKINILIGFDSRNSSIKFRDIFINILNKKIKINILTFKQMITTPILSYLVKNNEMDAGIMITASHNSFDYNGIKFFSKDGSQIDEKEEKQITKYLNSKFYFKNNIQNNGIKNKISFYDYNLDNYFKDLKKDILKKHEKIDNLKITFSPLYGSTYEIFPKLLKELKTKFLITENEIPKHIDKIDIKSFDPSMEESFNNSIQNAKKGKSDIILLMDPDGDRIGFAYKDKNNEYKIVSSNQIAFLIIFYLKELNEINNNDFIVTSKVSTNLIEKILQNKNVNHYKVDVGFKNIYKKILNIQKENKIKHLFSFEESGGFLFKDNLSSQKDAIQAATLILKICSYYKKNNIYLEEIFDEINNRIGFLKYEVLYLKNKNIDIKINKYLRTLENLNKDNQDFKIIREKNKFFKIYFNKINWIYFRKSGTENYYKFYLHFSNNNKNSNNKKIKIEKERILKDFYEKN